MLRIIAAILGVYGIYVLTVSYPLISWLHVILCAVCAIGSVALWLKRPWSKYIVYTVATLFIVLWGLMIFRVYERGWPYETAIQSVISLAPGILMVSVALSSMVIVHRAFKNVR